VAHGVGGQEARRAFPLLMGFRAAYQHGAGAIGSDGEIGNLDGHELTAARERIVGHGDERAIAGINRPAAGGGDHALDGQAGEASGLALARATLTAHALEGELHGEAGAWILKAGVPVARRDPPPPLCCPLRSHRRFAVDCEGEAVRGRRGDAGSRQDSHGRESFGWDSRSWEAPWPSSTVPVAPQCGELHAGKYRVRGGRLWPDDDMGNRKRSTEVCRWLGRRLALQEAAMPGPIPPRRRAHADHSP